MNANEHSRLSDLLCVVAGLPAGELIDEARACLRSALGERDEAVKEDLLIAALACVERLGASGAVAAAGGVGKQAQ